MGGVELGDARILQPGRLRWLRAIGWLACLLVLSVLAFNLAADAALRAAAWLAGEAFTGRAAAPAGARLVAVLAGSVAMLASYAIAVRLGEARAARELAAARFLPEVLAGIGVGGFMMAAVVGLLAGAGLVTVEAARVTQVLPSIKEAVQSAVIEELLLRLVIFRLLWRAFGAWPALALSALLFGALHLGNPGATLFAALCLIAGEGVGAGLYMLSGRLWLSSGWHAGWNFAQGWLFGAAVSGTDLIAGGPLVTRPVQGASPLLSGGAFGPEASLACLLVSLAASAGVLRLAWVRNAFRERSPAPAGERGTPEARLASA